MGSLEEARRTIEALAQEKDYYKDFWQATNNYHSVMSRFQVPAPSLTTAPFTSHFPYSSSSAPVSQVNAPQFSVSSYPLYSGTTGLVASEMHHLQSQEEGQPQPYPPRQSTITTPTVPDVAPQTQNPLLSTPETAAKVAQSPETPSKREATKSIESYFTSAKQAVSCPANTDPAPTSDEPVEHPTGHELGCGMSPLETPPKQPQLTTSIETTQMSTFPDPSSVSLLEKESSELREHRDDDWIASLNL